MKILLVECYEKITKAIISSIKSKKRKILIDICENSKAINKILSQNDYSAVLIFINNNNGDLKQIIKGCKNIPVIAVTDKVETGEWAVTQGAGNFILIKELNPKLIRCLIRNMTYKISNKESLTNPIDNLAAFKQLFSKSKNCIAIYSPYKNGQDFIFLDINSALEKTEKLNRADIIGKKVTDVFPCIKKFGLFQVFKRVYKTGQPENHEVTFYQDDRIKGWRENYVLKLPEGEIVTVYYDLTEQKQNELDLIKSEHNLASILNNCNDAVYSIDNEYNVLIINPKAKLELKKIMNIEFKQGQNILKSIPDDTKNYIKNYFDRALSGKNFTIEYRYEYNSDVYFSEISFYPIKNLNQVSGVSVISRDITTRKLAEHNLKEHDKNLKKIIENMPVMLDAFDKEFNIIFWNKECERVTGYKSGEIVNNKNAIKMLYPDKEYRDYILNTFNRTGSNFRNIELKITCKNGKEKVISWSNISYKNQILSWYSWAIGVDVTKICKAEKELIESNMELEQAYNKAEAAIKEMQTARTELENTNIKLEKAVREAKDAILYKTEFLANMSHEIRTPLTTIIGFNELLKEDKKINTGQREYLKLIEMSGKRLLNLLTDILIISEIEANKSKISKINIDLNAVLKEIQYLNVIKLKEKNIDFKYNLNGIEQIHTDPKRLNQILMNLIGNAIKFTDKGSISVDVKEKKGFYEFCVKDTGIGIKDDLLDKIFESFVIGETGYTKQYDGAGLGLNICYRLATLLGGKIWVKSEINKGSKFYFTIPVEKIKQEKQAYMPGTAYVKQRSTSGKKIAVIDDETIILKFVEKIIKTKTNHFSYTFSRGMDFLSEFPEKSDYSLILLDIRMPVMNGLDCLKRIRQIDPEIPVIAFTAFAMKEDKKLFLEVGFNDYILKPIDISELMAKIDAYV